MASRVVTTTISLPKAMARRARVLSHTENRTMSELVREALREYESRHRRPAARWLNEGNRSVSWKKLQASLKKISRSGRKVNLAESIAHDRLNH